MFLRNLRLVAVFYLLLVNLANAKDVEWRVVTEIAAPYQLLEDDKLTGLAVDMVKPVLADAGVTAETEVYPWARAYELAKSRKNTLIFSMVRLKEREQHFHWIGLIRQTRLSFISLAKNTNVELTSVDDARNYGIGAVRNDFNHQYLVNEGFKEKENFILRSQMNEIVDLLFLERVEVMLVNLVFLQELIPEKGFNMSDIRVHYQPNNAIRDVYLAANVNSDPEMVERLKALFIKHHPQN